ncbi:galectin-4-like [Dendropsophus ebraccatus]|uniref:galectin-4-like n=1 Tax=Dendropsophus ebraccatus TaxID=150705 RepID=UPI003831CF07
MTAYAPPEPYQAIFKANFAERQKVYIRGTIPESSHGFAVNLINSNTSDVYLHINPNFKRRTVVRNTLQDGKWGQEELDTPFMPFQCGKEFTMEIKNKGDALFVYVNGKILFIFVHRLPFKDIDVLEVTGNCKCTCVQF